MPSPGVPLSQHLDEFNSLEALVFLLVPRLARCALITQGGVAMWPQTEISLTLYIPFLLLPGSATIQSNLVICHLICHKTPEIFLTRILE